MTRPASIHVITVLILVTCLSGCSPEDDEVEPAWLAFHPHIVAGFDDFSSAGAALCCVIDTLSEHALILALRFSLPLASDNFQPLSDPAGNLEDYTGGRVNTNMAPMAASYPGVEPFLTDTQGIRGMAAELTAFLLELDSGLQTVQRTLTATDGEITLVRDDEPSDLVEGRLIFTEFQESDGAYTLVARDETLGIDGLYLQWATDQQSD